MDGSGGKFVKMNLIGKPRNYWNMMIIFTFGIRLYCLQWTLSWYIIVLLLHAVLFSRAIILFAMSAKLNRLWAQNERNFQSWKYNIKLVMMECGLWGFVQGSETPPQPTASVEVRNANRLHLVEVYSSIALSVDKSLQVHIASTVEPKAAWDLLQNHFKFASATQIVCLSHKFYAASMKEGGDLMEHITHVTSLAEQLREMKEDISLKTFSTIVLGSIPESYDDFITRLNATSADKLTWEDVKGLLVEECI